MNLLRGLFTGADNATHDLGRWSWAVSIITVIGHTVWAAIGHAAVDVMQVAQALGVVAAAHGGALFLKRDTEPKP